MDRSTTVEKSNFIKQLNICQSTYPQTKEHKEIVRKMHLYKIVHLTLVIFVISQALQLLIVMKCKEKCVGLPQELYKIDLNYCKD